MKVRSHVYPTTNIIPIDGGVLYIEDTAGLYDKSFDTQFVDVATTNVFTKTAESGVVNSLGDGRFEIGTDGTVDRVSWTLDHSENIETAQQTVVLPIEDHEHISGSTSPDTIASLGVGQQGTDELTVVLRYDPSGPDYQVYVDRTGGTAISTTPVSVDLPVKLCAKFVGDETVSMGYIDDQGYQELYRGKLTVTVSTWTVGLAGANRFEVELGKLVHYPVVTIPDEGPAGHPEFLGGGEQLFYEVNPGYPGNHQFTIWGTGTNFGVSDIGTLIVQDQPVEEDAVKFMVSPVEKLYDDAVIASRCRESAEELDEYKGNITLHSECVCDGSIQDTSKLYVEVVENKMLGKDGAERSSEDRFDFIFEEEQGDDYGSVWRYGENFDFQRIHGADDSIGLSDPRELKFLRTLELSNGDRVYYGVLYSPLISNQDIEIDTSDLNSGSWELRNADDDSLISSGAATSPPGVVSLAPGEYYLAISDCNATVWWDKVTGERLAQMQDMSVRYDRPEDIASTPETQGNYVGGRREHKLFFEVKQYLGEIAIWHYSKCDESIYSFTTGNEVVSLRSDSLAAVEARGGRVSFVYQSMLDRDIVGNRSTDVQYQVYDPFKGSFDPEGTIEFRNIEADQFDGFYAIDAVRVEDMVQFQIVGERDGYQMWSPELTQTPMNWSVRLDTEASDFEEVSFTYTNNVVRQLLFVHSTGSTSGWESMRNLYEKGYNEGELFTESYIDSAANHPMKGSGFRFLRSEYDQEREEIVLAMFNQRMRAPMVISGRGSKWRERSVPRHFNFFSEGFDNLGHSGQRWTNLKSISACYGADGMLYTAAVRGAYSSPTGNFPTRTCEIGVDDPEVAAPVIHLPSGGILDDGIDFALVPKLARWRSRSYGFSAVPFFNQYYQADGAGFTPEMAHIQRDDGYLVVSLGMHKAASVNDTKFPIVYQNGAQDTSPFEVPLDEVWTPELQNSTDYSANYIFWDDGDGVDNPYAKLFNGWTDGTFVLPEIARSFDAITKREQKAKVGYRFHTRVQKDTNDDNLFKNNFVFDVTAVGEIGDGDDYAECRARIVWNGSQMDCRVGDGAGGWNSVGTICDVGFDDIRDLEILIQQHDPPDRFRVLFVVKDQIHPDTGSSHSYDFRTRSKRVKGNGVAELSFNDTSPPVSNYGVSFDTTTDNSSSDMVKVYEIGWNQLRAPGLLSEASSVTKWIFTIGQNGYVETSGDRWREFNDVRAFGQRNDYPVYPFKVSEVARGTSLSNTYHWPNGFVLYFSGRTVAPGSRWMLDREQITNTSNIQMDTVHGNYATANDGSPVYIWADSHDSDLGDFEVDTFIVTGCNVPEVTIVGKDNEGDAWTELGVVDLRKYSLPSGKITEVNYSAQDKSVINMEGAAFAEGRFSEFVHYLAGVEPTSSNRAGVIHSSQGENFWMNTHSDFDFTSENAEVFANRAAKVLDTPVRYRYIGIRIDPYHTYEGRFTLHSFDFGRQHIVPLEYDYDPGSGAVQQAECETNFVFDEQPYVGKKFSLRKEFDLSYSVVDARTLSILKATVREVGVSRKQVWVLENNRPFKEKVYQCFIEGEPVYVPLIDEDGERYYEFEITLRSSE